MSTSGIIDINRLEDANAAMVLARISDAKYHQEPGAVNMRALAFVASSLAREHVSVDWARVAVAAYKILSEVVGDADPRLDDEVDEMRVKACLISRLGDKPGHDILDASAIVVWFTSDAGLSPSSAAALAAQLKGRSNINEDDLATLRLLRRLKNRLLVIELIKQVDAVRTSGAVQEWLGILQELP